MGWGSAYVEGRVYGKSASLNFAVNLTLLPKMICLFVHTSLSFSALPNTGLVFFLITLSLCYYKVNVSLMLKVWNETEKLKSALKIYNWRLQLLIFGSQIIDIKIIKEIYLIGTKIASWFFNLFFFSSLNVF